GGVVSDSAHPVALVSGGSRGLGAALVEGLLAAGYRVSTFSRGASPAREALEARHGNDTLRWDECDARNVDALPGLVRGVVEHFGRLDLLVNNAGVVSESLLPLQRQDDIDRMIDVNLRAVVALTQAASRAMLRRKSGCIVNISSVNGLRGHAGVAVYSATK